MAEPPELLISARWGEATTGLSLGASGLLLRLIVVAVEQGVTQLPLSEANVAPYVKHGSDRSQLKRFFAELRLRGLLKEAGLGSFAIAPDLWKLGCWDPSDKDWFPIV